MISFKIYFENVNQGNTPWNNHYAYIQKKYMNLEQILYSKESKSQSKLILKKIYMTKFLIPWIVPFQNQSKMSNVFLI